VTRPRPEPPALARSLLVRCAPPGDAAFLASDLEEEFQQRLDSVGAAAARRWYRGQVVASLGPLLRMRLVHFVHRPPAARRTRLLPLQHGVLQVVRNPRSSLLTIAIVGLTMGASIGIGAMVDRAVLRPLPYPDPDRLVVVFNTYPGWRDRAVLTRFWDRIDLSWPEYAALRVREEIFSDLAIHSAGPGVYHTPNQAEVVQAGTATHGLMRVLGTAPALGRWFGPGEDAPGARPAVVLSDAFWRARLGAAPDAIGREITLDGERHMVIGVLPRDFAFKRAEDELTPQVWQALGRFADPSNEGNHGFRGVARLRAGVTTSRALDAVTIVLRGDRSAAARGARLMSRDDYERAGARPVMRLFAAAVGVLLLLSCATVAALQLARIVARTREVAVRTAVGATPGRIVLQLLSENLVIGTAGGLLGALLAHGTIGVLARLLPPGTPGVSGAGIDARVLGLALALSLGTGILFGLGPILHVLRSDPARGLVADRVTPRSPALLVLVAVQSALAVLLVVGAGLLLRTVQALNAVEPGFATAQRLTFAVQLPADQYAPASAQRWHDELASRIRAEPGVLSVAGTSVLPLSGASSSNSIWLQSSGPESGPKPEAERRVVTPDWFAATGVPLLRGRTFTPTDDDAGERVAIVSRTAAAEFWHDREPLDDHVELSNRWWRVVGVVQDVRDRALEAEPVATVYVPAAQWKPLARQYVVATARPSLQLAPTVRALVRDLDPAVPVRDLRTLTDVARSSAQPQRARAILVGGYAVIATLLALAGLSGVPSYGVRRRTREFAIRAALGARRGTLARLAMRQSAAASLCGIAAGLAGAVVLARTLRAFLFGVPALDLLTFGGAAIGLCAVTMLAAAMPALGAGRVEPAERLRRD
jgi:predicted permease